MTAYTDKVDSYRFSHRCTCPELPSYTDGLTSLRGYGSPRFVGHASAGCGPEHTAGVSMPTLPVKAPIDVKFVADLSTARQGRGHRISDKAKGSTSRSGHVFMAWQCLHLTLSLTRPAKASLYRA